MRNHRLSSFVEYERLEGYAAPEFLRPKNPRTYYILETTRSDGWVHREWFWDAVSRQAYKLALALGASEDIYELPICSKTIEFGRY